MVSPDNSIWKLAVLVQRENPSLSVRLHEMAVLWRKLRNRGTSFYGATRLSWNTFYPAEADVVVSDPITNSVPTRQIKGLPSTPYIYWLNRKNCRVPEMGLVTVFRPLLTTGPEETAAQTGDTRLVVDCRV
jgi:hypothetical protein